MPPYRFQEGDPVVIQSLRKSGIITERLPGLKYRVALGSLHTVCHERDLELGIRREAPPVSAPRCHTLVGPRPPTSLDLHGLTVDDAIRKLERWLSSVIMAGIPQVSVIHGLGTGKLLRATHETLRRFSAVRSFRINDTNPGETEIFL